MSGTSNLHFYLARVEQAQTEKEATTLAQVRERCERSEAAWQALADRAMRGELLREQEVKRKEEAGLRS